MRPATAVLAVLAVAPLLAGCTSEDPLDPLTECVEWSWIGDLPALAGQIADVARAEGIEVVDVSVAGTQGFSLVRAGELGVTTIATLSFVVDVDGEQVTLTQEYTENWTAAWSWDGEPTATSGRLLLTVDEGSTFGAATRPVDGAAGELARDLPVPFDGDAALEVTCDAEGLTLRQEGSDLVTVWSRG